MKVSIKPRAVSMPPRGPRRPGRGSASRTGGSKIGAGMYRVTSGERETIFKLFYSRGSIRARVAESPQSLTAASATTDGLASAGAVIRRSGYQWMGDNQKMG